ncbi:DUF1476 family protein [Rhizobium sp. KVB221]|uniref:DUF1476 family protein n=1 Tax=Rhizobium setariae TaxID=2801340 RepID=A0A937CQX4_9HYPH|nr:ATPase inhibitor subunit zeta [Rhizobium setariae]MBL0374558.1 DUF1476 family protein [Rhizobium setariae]
MNDLQDMQRIALRDKLVGMWAAEELGLVGESAEAYINDLAKGALDFERNDVLAVIRKDFDAAGVVQSDEQISRVISQAWLAAGRQTNSADAGDVALVQIVRNLKLS